MINVDFKEAVIEQLIVHYAYKKEHESNAQKAVHDLLCISDAMALDPAISDRAQELINNAKREGFDKAVAAYERVINKCVEDKVLADAISRAFAHERASFFPPVSGETKVLQWPELI